MRVIACILIVITLLVGAFFGYCYYGTKMEIVGVAAVITPAKDALGTYNQMLDQLSEGSFLGVQYAEADFIMPDSYAFLTLNVRMRNHGIFPQEWIQIEVKPDASDILQLPADRTPSLATRTTADFGATLLTRTGADTARRITITYYVLGSPYSVEFEM